MRCQKSSQEYSTLNVCRTGRIRVRIRQAEVDCSGVRLSGTHDDEQGNALKTVSGALKGSFACRWLCQRSPSTGNTGRASGTHQNTIARAPGRDQEPWRDQNAPQKRPDAGEFQTPFSTSNYSTLRWPDVRSAMARLELFLNASVTSLIRSSRSRLKLDHSSGSSFTWLSASRTS